MMQDNVMLQVENLKKYFPIEKGSFNKVTGYVKAVDDVSFRVKQGETMGLVGESGCGKTTTSRVILRALEPTSGKILFRTVKNGIVDMAVLKKNELKKIRKDIQMVFQDPYSSLNPRMPVLDIISEPMTSHGWKKKDCKDRVGELLELVGLNPKYMQRYPHAFSGGQRQRIAIARALALNPSMIVADEPVSALDVSVQAQVLNLLNKLQEEMGLTYLFIAHNLSVIRYICDSVAVMYVGKLVEVGETESLFENPCHPYTSSLLSAVPDPDPHQQGWLEETLGGEVADPSKDISGCAFAPRCKYAKEICRQERPILKNVDKDLSILHQTACHRVEELQLKGVKSNRLSENSLFKN